MTDMTQIPPFEPRKWLTCVRDIAGDTYIIQLFCISIRTYQRWTAERPYVSEDSIRENYLEKHERLLTKLIRDGYTAIARSIVARHAELTRCLLVPLDTASPDKDTLDAEMLDDHPPLVRFHTAIQTGATVEQVRHLAEEARREIGETVELYKRMKDKG